MMNWHPTKGGGDIAFSVTSHHPNSSTIVGLIDVTSNNPIGLEDT